MTKRELSVSAAVLAVMIGAALRAEAKGEQVESVRIEKRRVLVKLADRRFEVARGSLPKSAEEMHGHLRIVPFYRDGRAAGMKLYAIQPDSPLVEAGFKNGDVVRTVAGIEVSTPEACLQAIEKVQMLDEFHVEIERQGEAIVLQYEVTR